MPFALEPTTATLSSVTNRVEKHGDEEVPAIILGLKITTANTILDRLSATLRTTLYKAIEGQEDLPGVEATTPLLRTTGIEMLSLRGTFEGWTCVIEHGIDYSTAIVMGDAKVDAFRVYPKEGGTVELAFRVGTSNVEPEAAGLLWAKNHQEVVITLLAPEPKADAIDGSTEAFEADTRADEMTAEDLFAATEER